MSRVALLVLWLLSAACTVIALTWMLLAVIAGADRALLIARGFDRLGNAVLGGDDGEYISTRCWRYRTEWPYRWLRRLVDAGFGPAHCEMSYEDELERAQMMLQRAGRQSN